MRVKTQNDLCADKVTLDYRTMLGVARSAFAYALGEVYSSYSQLAVFPFKESNSMRVILAEKLVDDADRLNTAANMMSTLEDGLDREEVEVVNHLPNRPVEGGTQ